MNRKLLKWIRYYNLDIDTSIQAVNNSSGVTRLEIITGAHTYSLYWNKQSTYLGASFEGGDLSDGKFSKKTFHSILADIVRIESTKELQW